MTNPNVRTQQEYNTLLAQIIVFLIERKKFNPKAAALCAKNYIETMDFAGIPIKPKSEGR